MNFKIVGKFRKSNIDYSKATRIESDIYEKFASKFHLHSKTESFISVFRSSIVNSWTFMQHYCCPTRLLDWTESTYIAAYFAVEQGPDEDGSTWYFPRKTLMMTMQKKFTDYRNKINSNREREQEIDLIVKNKIDFIVPIQTLNSDRSAAQQGMFTMSLNLLADHSHLIGEALSSISHSTYKLIIPNNLKNQFLSHLRVLNITASSLFPDLDGLGKSLDEFVRLNVWRENNQEGLEK